MRKLKERIKRVDIDPFNYTVIIVLTNDLHASAHNRGLHFGPGVAAFHLGADEGMLASQIVLPPHADMAIVAHECFHCVWHIMHSIGAQMEEEVMAYTLMFLMSEVRTFMETKPKRRKKAAAK